MRAIQLRVSINLAQISGVAQTSMMALEKVILSDAEISALFRGCLRSIKGLLPSIGTSFELNFGVCKRKCLVGMSFYSEIRCGECQAENYNLMSDHNFNCLPTV